MYSELWTAEWWHRQQISVGRGKNIIALIAYIDETPVTFNGRNMHPVYVSLGNIHVDFRYQPYFDTLNMIKLFMSRNQPSGKRLFGFVPNVKVRSAFRNSVHTRRYRRKLMRESMAFIFQQLLEWPPNKTRNFALGRAGEYTIL